VRSSSWASQSKLTRIFVDSMTVGAVNSTFFDGNLNWIPLTKESYWLIPMDDVSVGGTSLGMSAASVTIDTYVVAAASPQ
jgi:hypothetical protein